MDQSAYLFGRVGRAIGYKIRPREIQNGNSRGRMTCRTKTLTFPSRRELSFVPQVIAAERENPSDESSQEIKYLGPHAAPGAGVEGIKPTFQRL